MDSAPRFVPDRRQPTPTDRGALFGLGLYRVVTALWAAVVALVDAHSGVMDRPSIAFAVLGPVLAWSAVTAVLARSNPSALLSVPAQVVDLGLAAAVVAAEWLVYDGTHPLLFGSMWQLAPIISTGLLHGIGGGLVAGVSLGLLNGIGVAATGGLQGRALATTSAIVLLGVAGAASGAVMDRLHRAEDEVAEAHARERVARTLHDGVLQTLAAIQRRSTDPELVELAAQQDRDLRGWLRGDPTVPAARDLTTRLRALVAELQRRDGTEVDVVAVGSPSIAPMAADALVGAVGEAVTNAAKHGHARRVTVFVDHDEETGLVCAVHDDGTGFDPAIVAPGMGMTTSMSDPLGAVGGSVTVRSRPGEGTEVEFRLPEGGRDSNRAGGRFSRRLAGPSH